MTKPLIIAGSAPTFAGHEAYPFMPVFRAMPTPETPTKAWLKSLRPELASTYSGWAMIDQEDARVAPKLVRDGSGDDLQYAINEKVQLYKAVRAAYPSMRIADYAPCQPAILGTNGGEEFMREMTRVGILYGRCADSWRNVNAVLACCYLDRAATQWQLAADGFTRLLRTFRDAINSTRGPRPLLLGCVSHYWRGEGVGEVIQDEALLHDCFKQVASESDALALFIPYGGKPDEEAAAVNVAVKAMEAAV